MTIDTWPGRFVYVCSATGGAVVNRAPMLHAGSGRVAGLVIMRATSTPAPADWEPSDRSQAALPAERLVAYGRGALGLRTADVKVVPGHPDRFTDWTDVLNIAASMAMERDAEIVFNITGGRVACKLGAFMGFNPAEPTPALHVVSVRSRPFGVDLVSIDENGVMRQSPLPVEERLSLADHLASYDLKEAEHGARMTRQDRLRAAAQISDRVLARVAENKDPRSFNVIFAELYKKLGDRAPVEFELSEAADRTLRALELDVGVRDLAFLPDRKLMVSSQFALQFIRGGWLEAAIYARIQAVLRGRNDTEVVAGLVLEYLSGEPGRHRAIAEIDLAIFAEERPLLIEAKAVIGVKSMNLAVDRIAQMRQRLGGVAADAWIVAPLLDEARLKSIDALRNAEEMGIRILSGPAAVDTLETEVLAALDQKAEPHESRI